MPDIWTKHPEIVRDLLEAGGFTCGVAPRVLKERDPAWTCIVDGQRISGDLYIHHMKELTASRASLETGLGWALAVVLGGIVMTQRMARVFRRHSAARQKMASDG